MTSLEIPRTPPASDSLRTSRTSSRFGAGTRALFAAALVVVGGLALPSASRAQPTDQAPGRVVAAEDLEETSRLLGAGWTSISDARLCQRLTVVGGAGCLVRRQPGSVPPILEVRKQRQDWPGYPDDLFLVDSTSRVSIGVEGRLVGMADGFRSFVQEDLLGTRRFSFDRRRWEYLETCWAASVVPSMNAVVCVDPQLGVRFVGLGERRSSTSIGETSAELVLAVGGGATFSNLEQSRALRVGVRRGELRVSGTVRATPRRCLGRVEGSPRERCEVSVRLDRRVSIASLEAQSEASSPGTVRCLPPVDPPSAEAFETYGLTQDRQAFGPTACDALRGTVGGEDCFARLTPDGLLVLVETCGTSLPGGGTPACNRHGRADPTVLVRLSDGARRTLDLRGVRYAIRGYLETAHRLIVERDEGTYLVDWATDERTYVGPCYSARQNAPGTFACVDISGGIMVHEDGVARLMARPMEYAGGISPSEPGAGRTSLVRTAAGSVLRFEAFPYRGRLSASAGNPGTPRPEVPVDIPCE